MDTLYYNCIIYARASTKNVDCDRMLTNKQGSCIDNIVITVTIKKQFHCLPKLVAIVGKIELLNANEK